jgi:hypothetical protein
MRARVADATPPDSGVLFIRPVAGGVYRGFKLQPERGYVYGVTIPTAAVRAGGPYEFVVTLYRGNSRLTFPHAVPGQPTDWNYTGRGSWKIDVVEPRTPLQLFDPAVDATRLAFTRIGDAGRRGLFHLAFSDVTGRPVFRFELPVNAPADYTASLVVKDRIESRGETITNAAELRVRLRGLGRRPVLHLTLMEDDGTSWSAALPVDSGWSERAIPLAALTVGRGVLLP